MRVLPKPEVICTHESDLDGFVAGLLLQRLARKMHDLDVTLEAFHNHNWRQRSLPERSAWVTDLTFETRVDRSDWVIIDHHPVEIAPKRATLIHDTSKSASLLCYELCQEHGLGSPQLDRLVHLSNVADLFLQDDPEFALAQDYANLVKNYQFWNLYELIERQLEKLLDHPLLEVMAVKRRVENPLGYQWSKANITELSPTVGFVDTVVGNINLIVNQLLERQETPYKVLVTLFRKGNGTVIASLRSRNGEALKFAEQLQGGGHPNACAATLPRSVQHVPEGIQYLRFVLNPPPPKEVPLNHLELALEELDLDKPK
jgi:oligoribonuclease NrnB/cAMP/cGMP phosphodiesterase (DHH superfamily)